MYVDFDFFVAGHFCDAGTYVLAVGFHFSVLVNYVGVYVLVE